MATRKICVTCRRFSGPSASVSSPPRYSTLRHRSAWRGCKNNARPVGYVRKTERRFNVCLPNDVLERSDRARVPDLPPVAPDVRHGASAFPAPARVREPCHRIFESDRLPSRTSSRSCCLECTCITGSGACSRRSAPRTRAYTPKLKAFAKIFTVHHRPRLHLGSDRDSGWPPAGAMTSYDTRFQSSFRSDRNRLGPRPF